MAICLADYLRGGGATKDKKKKKYRSKEREKKMGGMGGRSG